MSSASDDCPTQLPEKQGKATRPVDCAGLDAEAHSELGRARANVSHFGSVLTQDYRTIPDWETIRAAWRHAVAHFSSAGTDPITGKIRPMPCLTTCDGTVITTLEQARRGLAHAEGNLQRIAKMEAALAAALQRIGELMSILDPEIAGGAV
jgi:hypothetical protein